MCVSVLLPSALSQSNFLVASSVLAGEVWEDAYKGFIWVFLNGWLRLPLFLGLFPEEHSAKHSVQEVPEE